MINKIMSKKRVFKRVQDGLPDSYPTTVPENGPEVDEVRSANRRIFNILYELSDDPCFIINVDRWGLDSTRPESRIFLPDQIGFMVVSLFPGINKLGEGH